MRHIISAAILLFVLTLFSAFAKEETGGQTFMWKATGAGNSIYLLGSIHVATEDFYPLDPAIEAAFAASKKLVVEVNMDAGPELQAKMMQLMTEKGMYKDGGSLSKNLSKTTYDLLKAYCDKHALPIQQLDTLRPWALALTVMMQEMQGIGFKPEFGIDMHFLKAAKDTKPILELETADSQVKLMADFPDDLQDKLLVQTLTDMSDLKTKINEMAADWKKGDAKALEELVLKDSLKKHPEIKPVFEKLFDERNVLMVEKLDGYLKSKDIHFVVVGAGHLLGEKGLVSLLQKKGYKLEQVKSAAAPK